MGTRHANPESATPASPMPFRARMESTPRAMPGKTRAPRRVRMVLPHPIYSAECDTCDTLERDSVANVPRRTAGLLPQNETSPFPSRKRLAAEDAWPERAPPRGC